jgi:hypothetical protein
LEKLRLFSANNPDERIFHVDRDVYAGLRVLYRERVQWEGYVSGKGDAANFLAALGRSSMSLGG